MLCWCDLSAQITASQTSGCAPLIGVSFAHPYTGATGMLWDFDNGASATTNSPTHTFQNPGVYNVTFTANGGIQASVTITVLSSPTAAFSVVGEASGCLPLSVSFQDESVAAAGASLVSWSWDFGDGGVSIGSNQNPSHIYTLAGVNDVVLVVQDNNGCSSSFSIDNLVTTSVPPSLTLNSNPASTSSCNAPFTVDFGATASSNSPSGNALTYQWDLGNGVQNSTANPPAQTYAEDGSYPVTVTVTDNIGCNTTVNTAVFVGSPQAGFELLGGPNFCDTVYFVNQSDLATTNINWGDGGNQNYFIPPDTIYHVYNSSGDFTATITVSSPGCESTESVSFTIDNVDVEISSSPNFSCQPFIEVNYVSNAPNADTYEWTFTGDSEIYTDPNVTYTHYSAALIDPYSPPGPNLYGASLTITTPAGCVGSASISQDTIWVPYAGFAVDISQGCAPLTVTFSDSSEAHTEIVNWAWHAGDGTIFNADSNEEDYAYTYTDHGEFDAYLVITTAEGCVDTSFVIPIEVGIETTPQLVVSESQVCPNTPVDFQIVLPPGIDADMWSIQTDNNQMSGCPNSPLSSGGFSSGAGMQSVTALINYHGCVSQTTFTNIIEVLGPVGHFFVDADCADPMTINCNGNITGADYWTYDFGDGNQITSSADQDLSHTYGATGDYLVTLTSFASTGCPPFIDTLTVRIRDVQASLTVDNPQICEGGILNLNAGDSQDVFAYCNEGYLWLFDSDMQVSPYRTETNGTSVECDQNGNFTIQLVAQDYNGCTDTASVDISVYGIDADFTMEFESACLPIEVVFNDASQSDTTLVSWFWNFGSGNTSSDISPQHTFTAAAGNQFNVTLTVTDTLGCVGVTSQTIVPDIPSAAFSASATQLCAGENITFNATNQTYPEYEWIFENGEIGDASTESVPFNTGGVFDVTLIVQNDAGCADTVTIADMITIQDYPDVGFSTNVDGLENLCYPILIEFTDTTNAWVFDYRDWDLGTGFPVVNAPTVGTIYAQPGTYSVSLEVGTTFGCVGTYEQDFIIEGPVADFAMSTDEICIYDAVTLTITDSSDVSYFTWDFGNGEDSANVAPMTYTYYEIPSGGSTFIQLITWSGDSVCSATTQYPFTVNQTIADFDRNLEMTAEDTIHCFGIQDIFSNQSIDATNYLWEYGNGITTASVNPQYTYPQGGEYEVTLYAFNATTGCSDTLTKPLTVFPKMNVGATDGLACLGDTIYLDSFGGETYAWSPSHLVSNASISDPYVFSNVNNELLLVVTDTNDCSKELIVKADYIFEPPYPSWTDTTITYGDQLLIPYAYEQYHTYEWTSGTAGCDYCGTPYLVPDQDMTFQLTVTDDLSCYEEIFYFNVIVISDMIFYMPNAFTPNADGVNDLFFPVITRAIERDFEFSIWNRYGERVWHTTDMNEKWNGSYQGNDYYLDNTEIFIWRVVVNDLKSIAHEFNGHVTLVR